MSDWAPGDLALCVHGDRGEVALRTAAADGRNFRIGGIYQVEAVVVPNGVLGLVLDGHRSKHPTGAYAAFCFRKVPPHEADEFDHEVIDLMNRKLVEVG